MITVNTALNSLLAPFGGENSANLFVIMSEDAGQVNLFRKVRIETPKIYKASLRLQNIVLKYGQKKRKCQSYFEESLYTTPSKDRKTSRMSTIEKKGRSSNLPKKKWLNRRCKSERKRENYLLSHNCRGSS